MRLDLLLCPAFRELGWDAVSNHLELVAPLLYESLVSCRSMQLDAVLFARV